LVLLGLNVARTPVRKTHNYVVDSNLVGLPRNAG